MSGPVTVSVELLEVGRSLVHPIYSCSGVLLLGAGITFFETFRDRLISRGIVNVLLNPADAAQMGVDALSEHRETARLKTLEGSINQKIDDFLAAHGTGFQRNGPALLRQLVHHGVKGISEETSKMVRQTQQKRLAAVNAVFDDAAAGKELSSSTIESGTNSCIDMLVGDLAGAISTTFSRMGEPSLATHAVKTSTLAMALAIEMGLDVDQVRLLGLSGMVADLGMARLPHDLVNAQRRLTRGELIDIQKHVIWTADILEKIPDLPGAVRIITYQTHENPDGSGYPRGRTMNAIHPLARILHTADTYAAMTTDRPDRNRLTGYAAMEILIRQARYKKHDPEVVRALLHSLSLCPLGSYVALSDYSIGVVVRTNGEHFTQPIVQLIVDPDGKRIDEQTDEVIVDLLKSDLRIAQALRPPNSNALAYDGRLTSSTGRVDVDPSQARKLLACK